MKYLVTYDLMSPGQDYSDLYRAIENLGEARHGMQNVWFIESNLTAVAIRDNLASFIDTNDKLFVCVIGSWAASNMENIGLWLNGRV